MAALCKNKGKSPTSHIQKEIVTYTKQLTDFKITFQDLTKSSPKDANIRKDAIKLAKLISENSYLTSLLIEQKRLPTKEVQHFVSGYKDDIKKYKKYIVAMSLLFIGEYTYLEDYINH